ncbi:SRPBCC domain-containing protein [Microbacterium sp. STN6]|uniref:SRPBCC family protein n=1 Tax=Microbacterium sp. STN6 TaxID=2995588 RepID=UPI0022609A4C|nr:SRPBCC domain-containing protein [Microbacterium sp. STN6]MCX7521584.1 SRPBCC domain-containing protein [Microbacterium sp. STN6]
MTVVSVQKDAEAMTLTFVAEFDAEPERVWELWADPRQLERWWGPPGWPATFERHEFANGGESRYYMSGPEGERAHGWWHIIAVEPKRTLTLDDGFADDNGEPVDADEPTRMAVTLEPIPSGTRMTTVGTFASADQLEKLLAMGMEEGMRLAMGQIDAILAETSGS